ncbi:MAG: DNA polymerase/3'-5' exonuclease PolX [Candidatus Thorarchaeota archaeon]
MGGLRLKNREIARLLHEISVLLEVEGKNKFKPRAFARAARSVEALGEDIEAVAARDALTEIPGVGKSIAEQIREYLATGKMSTLEKLRQRIPVKVEELEAIPGVGPKTIKLLYESLKVTDLESLERAINEGRLKGLRGIGPKTIAQIAEGIALVRGGMSRTLLSEALPIADAIVEHLKGHAPVTRIDVAGSLRRRKESVGDIDILVLSERPSDVTEAFVSYPDVSDVLLRGDTKTSIRLTNCLQVDLRLLPVESYGAGLQYFTGSKDHNVHLRSIAQRAGMKLNEYGLFKGEELVAGAEESEIYQSLGLQFIPPELREDQGEIEAAKVGRLPSLVELDDIRGDLHMHTDYSDGVNTLEEMVEAAEALGYEYICIADHTKSLTVAKGMDEEQILRRIDEIDDLNSSGRWHVHVLKGAEVDILPDGTLDLEDDVLSQLDVVTVSVHSKMQMDRATMTERIIRAIEHKHVHILGHPTGRKLFKRPAYEVDIEAIFEAARGSGVAMELNAYPERLDLGAGHLRLAKRMGIQIAINTDAHRTSELHNMRFGVFQARRGWLEADDIINTRSLDELFRFLKK